MRHFLALCVALTLAAGTIGCGKTAEVKKETTVTTPGGETTTTETKSVEKSGENPPPADTEKPDAGTTNP